MSRVSRFGEKFMLSALPCQRTEPQTKKKKRAQTREPDQIIYEWGLVVVNENNYTPKTSAKKREEKKTLHVMYNKYARSVQKK